MKLFNSNQKIIKFLLAISTLTLMIGLVLLITYLILAASSPTDYSVNIVISFIMTIVSSFVFGSISFYLYKLKTNLTISNIKYKIPQIQSILEVESDNGVIIYDQNNIINYISTNLLKLGFGSLLGKNFSDLTYFKEENFQFKNNYFNQKHDASIMSFFIKKTTDVETWKSFFKSKKMVFIGIKVKFYSLSNLKEQQRAKINVNIFESLSKIASETESILFDSHSSDEPNVLISTWENIKSFFDSENKLFNTLKKELGEYKKYVSISIGVSKIFTTSISEMKEDAFKNITLAENRGGNVVALQDDSDKLIFLGESEISLLEESNQEIKFYYEYLNSKAYNSTNIFLTAHIMADSDAIASTIALAHFLKTKFNKETYVIMESFDQTVKDIISEFPSSLKKMMISETQALKLIAPKSILIILDVNDAPRIQGQNVIKKINNENIFIIDHHRIGDKFLKTTQQNLYLDTSSSSTSEIITQFIQSDWNKELEKDFDFLATLLMCGIFLDTNNLSRQTNPKTYEVISWLIKHGGNELKSQNWNEKTYDESMELIEQMYKNIQKITNNVLFAAIPEKIKLSSSDISNLADRLLAFKEIDAAFLMGKTEGKYKLSARSKKNINVQLICEKLGGGGHFELAAANVNEPTYSKAEARVKKEIKSYIDTYQTSKKSNKKTNEVI